MYRSHAIILIDQMTNMVNEMEEIINNFQTIQKTKVDNSAWINYYRHLDGEATNCVFELKDYINTIENQINENSWQIEQPEEFEMCFFKVRNLHREFKRWEIEYNKDIKNDFDSIRFNHASYFKTYS